MLRRRNSPDVAVLGTPSRWQWLPRGTDLRSVEPTRLDRIYRRSDGEVVRETLVTLHDLVDAHLDAFSEVGRWNELVFRYVMVKPDGSHVHIGVCTSVTRDFVHDCRSSLGLFRSTDGGVTWSYLGSVNLDDEWGGSMIVGVLPGEEPQLAVVTELDGTPESEVQLFPSGETRIIDHRRIGLITNRADYRWRLLRDGRLATQIIRNFERLWLAEDGEELGSEIPDHLKVVLPETSSIPSDLYRHYLPGYDPPDDWPTDRYLFYNLENVSPYVIVQHGPFLHVTDVGEECLPIRSEPSSSSEELACIAEHVLLTDLGDMVTDEGVTWHRMRTPAGIEGWSDGSYLE